MRLICPNCGAQYEVPVEVIPEDGRDVQCSSCQHTWFQTRSQPGDEDAAAEPVEPADEDLTDDAWEEEPERPAAPEPRRAIDPEIADVFREEREYESRRRSAEAEGLETQPDLGLGEPEPDARERREREARAHKAAIRGEEADRETAEPATVAATASRRDLLPDVEEINQTLRSSSQPRAVDMAARRSLDEVEESEKRGGFTRGFALVVLVAALAVGVYVSAPRLAVTFPGLTDALSAYVAAVDQGRAWLDARVAEMLLMLDGMSAEAPPPNNG
ncbi:zinc-ribbon domain-containing protein [Thetidibacter halocola]|uniref:Zinc-ribbon domain-containing protein n=1 Tax=Thetidibacter halocola TaxID=2827239 RepID=A0A8J7WIQ9_9RHOB|nr:zinc-ribbon domain-containing protein [Thetidibacter halocola]MBS0126053.1 zinc-ribbon domain-containing protein [Thetidibacter halocola]